MKVILVVGARPNFMKVAPILSEMNRFRKQFQTVVLHTGQHYDYNMSGLFFKDLGLVRPDIFLGIGSGSQAVQTAKIMMAFERVCLSQRADLIIVVGDVNSTLACSLTAAKLHIPVAHVEAGLRSFDRFMPEEINRMVTDTLSDYLFTTCVEADRNLKREGISSKKVFFVGNTMIDTLKRFKDKALAQGTLRELGLTKGGYALLTLHRPSNVDDRKNLHRIFGALTKVRSCIEVVFPMHPRTRKQIEKFGLGRFVSSDHSSGVIRSVEPLGYLDFLNLMVNAKLIFTDSGGIQEETTVVGVPCLTLRNNTERSITIKEGSNVLVGTDPRAILRETEKVLLGRHKRSRIPKKWDGRAAQRIVRVLLNNRRHLVGQHNQPD